MEGYRSIEPSPRNQFEDMSGRREHITITEKIPKLLLEERNPGYIRLCSESLEKGGDVEHNSH